MRALSACVMGNCHPVCAAPDVSGVDTKKSGKGGVEDVVEEVDTLEEQAKAAAGDGVTVSVTPAASKKSVDVPVSETNGDVDKEVDVSLHPIVSMLPDGEGSEKGSEKSMSMASDASQSKKSAVSFSAKSMSDVPEEGEIEEPVEEVTTTGNFIIDAYVHVFNFVFVIMLQILATGAALLHMVTRNERFKWPDFVPITRLSTSKFMRSLTGSTKYD